MAAFAGSVGTGWRYPGCQPAELWRLTGTKIEIEEARWKWLY